MEYGKNTAQEFAEFIEDQIQGGASQSDIVQFILNWQKPLVELIEAAERAAENTKA